MRAHLLAVVPVLVALATGGAHACAPPDPDRIPEDRPISVAPDGSFVDASADDGWSLLRGRPIRDIGGGRTGQVIEANGGCELAQTLLFVDCTAGAAIMVNGTYREGVDDGRRQSTLALQPPHGPLALTGDTTVAQVAALAAREGWGVRTDIDIEAWIGMLGERNRFDPYLGCALLYPGSPGAALSP